MRLRKPVIWPPVKEWFTVDDVLPMSEYAERRLNAELRVVELLVGAAREVGVEPYSGDVKRLGELYTAYHRQRGVTYKARERAGKINNGGGR